MKSHFSRISSAVITVLFLMLLAPAFLQASETIKYSCSNQVYQAFDKEKIEAFSQETGIKVEVFLSSSGSAVYRLMNNFSDIASTARKLDHRANMSQYLQTPICRDPMAFITHAQCGVNNISQAQLQDILSGRITNWKSLGGGDLPVTVVVPGIETAAYKNIKSQVMGGGDINFDFMAYDSTMAIEAVTHFPCGTISFIARGAVVNKPEISALAIDGRFPLDSDYPYFQQFYYVTKGEPKDAVKAFIEFSYSPKGLEIMKKKGMVP